MVILQNLWMLQESQETMLRDGEPLRTLQDLQRILGDTCSGEWMPCTPNRDGDSCMFFLFITFTTLWSCTLLLRALRKTWLASGCGQLVNLIDTTDYQRVTLECQLIELKTTFVIQISIKWRGIKESLWSIRIGGAETRTSESTSIWEKITTSSHLGLASMTSQSTKIQWPNTRCTSILEQVSNLSDQKIIAHDI